MVDEGRRRHGQVGGGIYVLARNPLYSWRTSEQVFKCLQSSVLLLDDALCREIQQVFGRRPPPKLVRVHLRFLARSIDSAEVPNSFEKDRKSVV